MKLTGNCRARAISLADASLPAAIDRIVDRYWALTFRLLLPTAASAQSDPLLLRT
jgi:hypothetical protein